MTGWKSCRWNVNAPFLLAGIAHTFHVLISHPKWPRSQTGTVKQEFSVSFWTIGSISFLFIASDSQRWYNMCASEYRRGVGTKQKSSWGKRVCVCVCAPDDGAWLVSICKGWHLFQSNDLETFTHLIHLPLYPPHKSYCSHFITHRDRETDRKRDRSRERDGWAPMEKAE